MVAEQFRHRFIHENNSFDDYFALRTSLTQRSTKRL